MICIQETKDIGLNRNHSGSIKISIDKCKERINEVRTGTKLTYEYYLYMNRRCSEAIYIKEVENTVNNGNEFVECLKH